MALTVVTFPLSLFSFRAKFTRFFFYYYLLEPLHMGCHNSSMCLIYCSLNIMYFALKKLHFHLIVLIHSVCDETK